MSKVHGPEVEIVSVPGELQTSISNFDEEARSYRRALELRHLRSEQTFLAKKLDVCSGT